MDILGTKIRLPWTWHNRNDGQHKIQENSSDEGAILLQTDIVDLLDTVYHMFLKELQFPAWYVYLIILMLELDGGAFGKSTRGNRQYQDDNTNGNCKSIFSEEVLSLEVIQQESGVYIYFLTSMIYELESLDSSKVIGGINYSTGYCGIIWDNLG